MHGRKYSVSPHTENVNRLLTVESLNMKERTFLLHQRKSLLLSLNELHLLIVHPQTSGHVLGKTLTCCQKFEPGYAFWSMQA